jgi:hypothetical protein
MKLDLPTIIKLCYAAVGLAIVTFLACSYTTNVRYHTVEPVSAPLVISGVEIIPSFYASRQGSSKLDMGPPWHLVVTSVAPPDALTLLVSEAIAKGDGWQKSLLPEGQIKTGTYRSTADGLKWFQTTIDDVGLDEPIPNDATFALVIRGIARLKDDELPFEGKFTFKSDISTKTVRYNRFIDQ